MFIAGKGGAGRGDQAAGVASMRPAMFIAGKARASAFIAGKAPAPTRSRSRTSGFNEAGDVHRRKDWPQLVDDEFAARFNEAGDVHRRKGTHARTHPKLLGLQ